MARRSEKCVAVGVKMHVICLWTVPMLTRMKLLSPLQCACLLPALSLGRDYLQAGRTKMQSSVISGHKFKGGASHACSFRDNRTCGNNRWFVQKLILLFEAERDRGRKTRREEGIDAHNYHFGSWA